MSTALENFKIVYEILQQSYELTDLMYWGQNTVGSIMLQHGVKTIYRSSDSGTLTGSSVIVGRIRWVPSDIHP